MERRLAAPNKLGDNFGEGMLTFGEVIGMCISPCLFGCGFKRFGRILSNVRTANPEQHQTPPINAVSLMSSFVNDIVVALKLKWIGSSSYLKNKPGIPL